MKTPLRRWLERADRLLLEIGEVHQDYIPGEDDPIVHRQLGRAALHLRKLGVCLRAVERRVRPGQPGTPRFNPYTHYDRAVDFIALNDEPGCLRVKEVADSVSVITVSEAFGVPAIKVAREIVRIRKFEKESRK